MRCKEFPHCCTAHVIVDFGESIIAEGGNHPITKDVIKAYIKMKARIYDHHAFLTATTNNEQKTANKALAELGFKHSKWMIKEQHPQTKVRLWFAHITDLLK